MELNDNHKEMRSGGEDPRMLSTENQAQPNISQPGRVVRIIAPAGTMLSGIGVILASMAIIWGIGGTSSITNKLENITGKLENITGKLENITGRQEGMAARLDDMQQRTELFNITLQLTGPYPEPLILGSFAVASRGENGKGFVKARTGSQYRYPSSTVMRIELIQ